MTERQKERTRTLISVLNGGCVSRTRRQLYDSKGGFCALGLAVKLMKPGWNGYWLWPEGEFREYYGWESGEQFYLRNNRGSLINFNDALEPNGEYKYSWGEIALGLENLVEELTGEGRE